MLHKLLINQRNLSLFTNTSLKCLKKYQPIFFLKSFQQNIQPFSSNSFISHALSDDEILQSLNSGKLSHHKLESITNGDVLRAIKLRRQYIQILCQVHDISIPVDTIQANSFYNQVNGANCETVIGYIPLPVGIAGPLQLDGKSYYVPMATTEGALIASTNRGARAIFRSGGASTVLLQDGMTRAPALECDNLIHAATVKEWIENPLHFNLFQDAFRSTTRFGKLISISVKLAGRLLFIRMKCFTGDAMGMNMIGKGSNEIVTAIINKFPTLKLKALSGNYCTDKKPAAINWIEGRGKSVAAEAVIHKDIVKSVLKTSVDAVIEVNLAKNMIGSAMAGSMGGFNAHSANMLTAVYLATGQDPAQNVESSNCITLMEKTIENDLRISVTMPCIEVGTVGGGTSLPAQKASLSLLGIAGAHSTEPGANSRQLARIVAGTVLAGELSLMAALSVNHLVSAHMQLNRKPTEDNSKNDTMSSKSGHVSTIKIEEDVSKIETKPVQDESHSNTINVRMDVLNRTRKVQKVSSSYGMDSFECSSGYAVHRCPVP